MTLQTFSKKSVPISGEILQREKKSIYGGDLPYAICLSCGKSWQTNIHKFGVDARQLVCENCSNRQNLQPSAPITIPQRRNQQNIRAFDQK